MVTSKQKILIVEDEIKLAKVLQEYLEQAGYTVHCLHNGNEVIDWMSENHPNLVILDLMLPSVDGITLCTAIRDSSEVPIIMATARVEEADRLKGLELGADDYVCKPYSLKEMVARVQVVLRRVKTIYKPVEKDESSSTNAFDIISSKMSIHTMGHALDLTPVEFRLLSYLIHQPGVVFSRNDLLNVIYDDYRLVSDRTIDSHIKNIRKKIQIYHPTKEFIQSIYGIGYKFEHDS